MAALPGCTITDTYAALGPAGTMRPRSGTITAQASAHPLFVLQTGGVWIEHANVVVNEPDTAGVWTLVLPSQPNCDPATVTWTITLPDSTRWTGAVTAAMVTASQTHALTLYDLRATYGWALVNTTPSTSLATYVATRTALGMVLLDRNPASGNPIAVTQPSFVESRARSWLGL